MKTRNTKTPRLHQVNALFFLVKLCALGVLVVKHLFQHSNMTDFQVSAKQCKKLAIFLQHVFDHDFLREEGHQFA